MASWADRKSVSWSGLKAEHRAWLRGRGKTGRFIDWPAPATALRELGSDQLSREAASALLEPANRPSSGGELQHVKRNSVKKKEVKKK
jgi:hypothetical protein